MQSNLQTYGTMYGMKGMRKTTVYLPEGLLVSLKRTARELDRSEAELIRQGVELVVAGAFPPKPTLPLFDSGFSDTSERVDELMAGFGSPDAH